MTITISNPVEQNVVNVGDEISSNQLAAIQNSSSPSAENPFVTVSGISEISNPFDQSLNKTDSVLFGSAHVVSGGSSFPLSSLMGAWQHNDTTGWDFATSGGDFTVYNGVFTLRLNGATGITFPDNTVQTTAYTGSGGGNPFDQSLNTTDDPTFTQVSAVNGLFGDATGSLNTYSLSFSQDGNTYDTYSSTGITFSQYSNGIGFSNATSINKGTFDNGYGGQSGISLNCAVGYELNWQAGRICSTPDGGTTKVPIIFDSNITFPDGTTQSTAYTGTTPNIFDQSLNTDNNVIFAQVNAYNKANIEKYEITPSTFISQIRIVQDDGVSTLRASSLVLNNAGIITSYTNQGINFSDGSSQTTAGISASTASSTYQTIAGMSAYQTVSGMSAYQTVSGMSAYQTVSGMSAYQTVSGMSAYAAVASTNTFSANQVVAVNTSGTAVRITQLGTGEAFRVEDETSPDSTPFVIDSTGKVGIGTTSLSTNALSVIGNTQFSTGQVSISNAGTATSLSVTNSNTGQTTNGASFSYAGTGTAFRITNTGSGNSFLVEDAASTDTTPFVIDTNGNVIIGGTTVTAGYKLDVIGNTKTTAVKIGTSSDITAVTYETTGQPSGVNRGDYPNEIRITLGGVTYAMPARQV